MKSTAIRLILASLITVLLSQTYPALARDRVRDLVDGNTGFAFRLYGELAKEEGTSPNIFFSSYSISAALGMTYIGAREETAREMAEVMKWSVDQEDLAAAFGSLDSTLNALQKEGQVKLSIANALWSQSDFPFSQQYIDTVREGFKAECNSADFTMAEGRETASRAINAWVAAGTNDKITEVTSPYSLKSSTRLILVNAVYFKGTWLEQFDPKKTSDGEFRLGGGGSVTIPLMRQEGMFKYLEADKLQVLEMPYLGNTLSMIVLLPREPDGLPDLERNLDERNLSNWIEKLRGTGVAVSFPRFKSVSSFDLEAALQKMGMKEAFTEEADFSGMGKGLFITSAKHQALVEVNEEGTEAAAVTKVEAGVTSLPPEFRADHPFIYLIRENSTGSILFLGRMADPTK